MDTDWSYDNAAIGAVLMQKQQGLERVIAYGGHKLSQSQKNYGPTKGELYAVVFFVNYYKYYLAHRSFIIRTDHQALKHMTTMEPPTGMIQRWLHLLSCYSFTVEHRAGTKHLNADAMSRLKHLPNNVVAEEDEQIAGIQRTAEDVSSSLSKDELQAGNWSPHFIKTCQENDPNMTFLFSLITGKRQLTRDEFQALSHTGRFYANSLNDLSLDTHGIIRYRLPQSIHHLSGERNVCILPEVLVHPAVMKTHRQLTHLATTATFNRLKLYAYFPNMTRRIRQILLTCGPCQTKTTRLPNQHHTLRSRLTGFPFQILSLDFVGPFPPSHPKKNVYLLTIKDVFTKWIEAFPLKHATASEVVRILNDEIFSRFGKCEQIHSDRGTQFTGDMMKELGKMLKIKLTFTPAYNPKSNPVERSHREIKSALLALSQHKPSSWDHFIPSILYALRCSISRTTGFSPFQLMFGRDPIDDLDTMFSKPQYENELLSHPEYFQQLHERMIQSFQLTRENMKLAVARQQRSYFRQKTKYEPGQFVWLFTPMLGQRQVTKMQTGWSGPWIIKRRLNDLTYLIAPTEKLEHSKTEVVAIDRLRRHYKDESDLVLPPMKGVPITLDGDMAAEDPILPENNEGNFINGNLEKEAHQISTQLKTAAGDCDQRKTTPERGHNRKLGSNSKIVNPHFKSKTKKSSKELCTKTTQDAPNEVLKKTSSGMYDVYLNDTSSLVREKISDQENLSDLPIGLDETRELDMNITWDCNPDVADWSFSSLDGNRDIAESPSSDKAPARPNSPAPLDEQGELTAREQAQASRRARYETRTGQPRISTPEGMKSTRENRDN